MYNLFEFHYDFNFLFLHNKHVHLTSKDVAYEVNAQRDDEPYFHQSIRAYKKHEIDMQNTITFLLHEIYMLISYYDNAFETRPDSNTAIQLQ